MKRLFKLLALLLVLSCIANATTHVNTVNATNNASSSLTSPTWSSTAGDIVVCSISTFSETVTTVVDSSSNGLTNALGGSTHATTPGGGNVYLYYLLSSPGGATYSVTVNGSAAQFISFECSEFSPTLGNQFVSDTANSASASATTASVNLTSVTATDLIVASTSKDDNTNNVSAGSGFTIPTNGSNITGTNQPSATEYQLSSSSGTVTVTMTMNTTSTGNAIVAAAFKLQSTAGIPIKIQGTVKFKGNVKIL